MWADYLEPKVLRRIQSMGIVTVNIAMDDRLPHHWQRSQGRRIGAYGLADTTDLVLNTSPECCVRYLLTGCPAIHWALAADPTVFLPAKQRDIEICFVGSAYGNRAQLVTRLEEKGFRVSAFGAGFPLGAIRNQEAAGIFGRSRIALGIGTVGHSRRIVTMKLRDFEATMAGCAYITNRNDDLRPYFEEGKEIVYYDTFSDLVEKLAQLRGNGNMCEMLGRNAAARCRREHTWDKRFEELFQFMGLLNVEE